MGPLLIIGSLPRAIDMIAETGENLAECGQRAHASGWLTSSFYDIRSRSILPNLDMA